MTRRVHFWTKEVTQDEVASWDPDLEPARWPTGRGHAVYELFVRLWHRGRPVTLGARPPRDTDVIVTALECIANHKYGFRAADARDLDLLAVRVPRVVVIRGDMPFSIPTPRYASIEIAPNPVSASDRARWLPLLPQRGMIPRASARRHRVDVVAIKSMIGNVPQYIQDGSLARELEQLGVDLRIDSDPAIWPDFAHVDAVLCVREPHALLDREGLARKPPTKLINAWCAGAIPLVSPEPAYAGLARDGVDSVVVDGPASVVTAVGRLRSELDAAAALFEGLADRTSEFAIARVLEQWERLLWGSPIPPRRVAAIEAVASRTAATVSATTRHHGRRALKAIRRTVRRAVPRLSKRR